jgi:hypothetical protein
MPGATLLVGIAGEDDLDAPDLDNSAGARPNPADDNSFPSPDAARPLSTLLASPNASELGRRKPPRPPRVILTPANSTTN